MCVCVCESITVFLLVNKNVLGCEAEDKRIVERRTRFPGSSGSHVPKSGEQGVRHAPEPFVQGCELP